jgi:hypothetical protein
MGLMNRVLRTTGAVAGDGLLKRALELRQTARQNLPAPAPARSVPLEPAAIRQVDAEKKKPSQPYSTRAA